MKLLWICGASILGGAERASLEILGGLARRGHRVAALVPQASPVAGPAAAIGLDVHRAPLGGSLNVRSVGSIRRALAALAPDAALVTTVDEWVWACLALPRRSPARLVLVRHMVLPLARRVLWLAARRADLVIAVSEAARQALLAAGSLTPERVLTIHNPSRFAPRPSPPLESERERARAALGLAGAGRWVAFLGGFSGAKGIREVLGAVAEANRKVGETHLVVCGRREHPREAAFGRGGPEEEALGARLHDLGETERVAEVLTAADVVVGATRHRLGEALPLTLIEALACGTPVVASATGGVAEVLGADGECGRLAAPDDSAGLTRCLIETLRDDDGRRRMAGAGLERARARFSLERAVDGYEAALGPSYRSRRG